MQFKLYAVCLKQFDYVTLGITLVTQNQKFIHNFRSLPVWKLDHIWDARGVFRCVWHVSCAGVRGRVRWPCRKRSSCLRVWTSWRGKWKMRHVNWRPWPAPNKPSPRGSTALRWACCSSGSITQLCKQRSERRSCFVNGRAGWRILTAVRRERRTSGLFWEKPGRSRISAKIPRSERTSCAAWARSPASPPNSPSSRERTYLSAWVWALWGFLARIFGILVWRSVPAHVRNPLSTVWLKLSNSFADCVGIFESDDVCVTHFTGASRLHLVYLLISVSKKASCRYLMAVIQRFVLFQLGFSFFFRLIQISCDANLFDIITHIMSKSAVL